jgi:hypothetical protein
MMAGAEISSWADSGCTMSQEGNEEHIKILRTNDKQNDYSRGEYIHTGKRRDVHTVSSLSSMADGHQDDEGSKDLRNHVQQGI